MKKIERCVECDQDKEITRQLATPDLAQCFDCYQKKHWADRYAKQVAAEVASWRR
jgi:hypothetical protein